MFGFVFVVCVTLYFGIFCRNFAVADVINNNILSNMWQVNRCCCSYCSLCQNKIENEKIWNTQTHNKDKCLNLTAKIFNRTGGEFYTGTDTHLYYERIHTHIVEMSPPHREYGGQDPTKDIKYV